MKLIKRTAIVGMAAATLLSTGILTSPQTVKASDYPVVRTSKVTYIYTKQGNLVKNRALQANTDWRMGKQILINAEYYDQVATNEYVKDSEVYDPSIQQQNIQFHLTGRVVGGNADLFDTSINRISSRKLAEGSEWAVSKAVINQNGVIFYKISKTEWVPSNHMWLNNLATITYDAGFGLNANDNNNDSNTNTGTNTNNNNTSTNTNTSKPTRVELSKDAVRSAILKSVNDERASLGVAPLQETPGLTQTAVTRANEIVQSFSHTRPNGSDCFSAFDENGLSYHAAAENIDEELGGSGSTPEQLAAAVMKSFKDEPGHAHYNSVVSSTYNYIGISSNYDATTDRYYISQDFIGM